MEMEISEQMNIFKRTLTGLVPTIQMDWFDKLKIGEEIEVKPNKTRNLQHHKKFFVLVKLLFDNQDKFDTIEDFRAVFTMRCGYYRAIETEKGTVHLPTSIKFSKMDQTAFDEFYDKAVTVACDTIGADKQELLKELSEF